MNTSTALKALKSVNVKSLLMKGLAKTKEYSPTILTIMAVGGVVTTVYFAVENSRKADAIIKEAKDGIQEAKEDADDYLSNEEEVEIELLDKVKLTWKCYIPTAISAGMTMACVIGANSINLKRNAAIVGLYTVANEKLQGYEEKIKEILPKKEQEKLRDALADKKLDDHPLEPDNVIFTNRGDFLCLDEWSGRYFRTDRSFLDKVETLFNKRLIGEYSLSLNDLYEMLDLDMIGAGDNVGWNSDHYMEFDFTTRQTKRGEPCLVMDFRVPPSFMYRG